MIPQPETQLKCYILPHLHVNLEGTDSEQHLGWCQQWTCSGKKTSEIFRELLNALGIADYILALGYNDDSRHHDKTLK